MKRFQQAFTIVELLIVIVVVAILAAITVVAYNGITNNAKQASLKSDLSTAAKKIHLSKVESDAFPVAKPDYVKNGLVYYSNGSVFCVSGRVNTKTFSLQESGGIKEEGCTLPVATTMQQFSSAHCDSQPVYTGANPAAIQTLTDSRGGTVRTYEVAKLADGKCWMLTNLKLGSTTGTITLTAQDSNVASSFVMAPLGSFSSYNLSTEYDTPYALAGVSGDTGLGATNYGYLYN